VTIVAAAGVWAGQAVAQHSPRLHVTAPSLAPAFDPSVPDYVVGCAKEPVEMSFSAPSGVSVSVDGGRPRHGAFRANVRLSPGQAFRFVVTAGRRESTYIVRCLPPDFPGYTTRRSGQPQAAWYVVAPCCTAHYAAIFDNHGVPVWWFRTRQPVLDTSLLPDGDVAVGTLASGSILQGTSPARFDEYRLNGKFKRTFSIPGGIETDRHELQVLPNGDYIVVAHLPRSGVDLRPYGGPADATVLDALIAEVSPQHKLVWSWNSSNHISLAESARWYPQGILSNPTVLPDGRSAYDIVHINAVAQHGDGFLISLRHTDAIYAISRASGDIEWKLGGTHTAKSLKLLGDHVSDFGGQHDVRVLADGTITLHDNGTRRDRGPRALRFRINPGARTARLVESIVDRQTVASSWCCGGARRLPGGDWGVSWGAQRVVTELTAADKPVFVLEFADQTSYRVEPVLPGVLSRRQLDAGMDAMHPRVRH
jgi:hypothetical protein